jgi:hypothetical protein
MNYEETVSEGLESSMELWLMGNAENAVETFGEDIVAAINEALAHD